MNKQLKGHLINFFRQLIQSQKTLQCIRKELSILKQYHPACLFNKIAGSNEAITIKLMTQYVKDRISCNQRDIYNIFQKFDHNRRGFILKEDFCKELHPSKKMPKLRNNMSVTYEIESKFHQYLSTIVKSCRVLDVWRKEISICEPYKIFEALDINFDGRIGPSELSSFFLRNSERINVNGARFLYQILLRRHYKQINLEVFCENLNPRQFGGYFAFQQQINKQTKMEVQQKLKKQKQAVEAQKNFYKQLNNEKVIQLVHKQASLIREKQLEDRIKDEIQVYQNLKFLTRKKYHPQLTYQQFLRLEKQNVDRINLEKRLMMEEVIRKESQYQQCLLHVDVVRQVEAFERSRLQRLPFMTAKNRIKSNTQIFQKKQLEARIKKNVMNKLNKQIKTPIARMLSIQDQVLSSYRGRI